MASPKISTPNNAGFTLIETLIALSLMAMLAGIGLVMGFNAYRASYFHSDRDMLISLLQSARAQAMSGMCSGSTCIGSLAHGVHLGSGQLTLFEGDTFDPQDGQNETVPLQRSLVWSGSNDVVFAPSSGDATPASITLVDSGHIATITITELGAIMWSN